MIKFIPDTEANLYSPASTQAKHNSFQVLEVLAFLAESIAY